MIDWLSFTAPLAHDAGVGGPFYVGKVTSTVVDSTHPAGELDDWFVVKRMALVGSYSKAVQVQSVCDETGRPGSAITVSGCPAKFFQGHNIFGSSDVAGLVVEMLLRICAARGIVPSEAERAVWAAGSIRMQRVDLTESWDFGSLPRVRNALRSLDRSAHLKHRGRGHFYGDSITFGKRSERWSLTFYSKGAELAVKGHELHPLLSETSLPSHAAGLLRGEVRMLGKELERRELRLLSAWHENVPAELHAELVGSLELSESTMIDAPTLDGLPGKMLGVYALWREGHDIRGMYSRPTFYKYRRELLAHGIDIAVKQPREPVSNVVPLRIVLHGYPVGVPEWAKGTPLYFEPRAMA